ncbi:MAG: SMC-Scp complex subunit ScpB [Actinobacteria bacterium]|nr:MAG: SMC-Scp complex subunit ScpB [Actinomycetota bacterium]
MTDTAIILEAILFVAEDPVSSAELAEVTELPKAEIEEALESLASTLAQTRGVVLRHVGGGWRLYTHPDALPFLERFASTDRAKRLSAAALEALAVVAYKQPVSRGQVGEIRGVDSERVLKTLERRGLVVEIGTAPGPGQAVLYGTTDVFLEKLGVHSLADLPPLADHVPPAQIVETLELPMRPEQP